MGKGHNGGSKFMSNSVPILPQSSSLLDVMIDNREFESLLKYRFVNLDITNEIRKSLVEIKSSINCPSICYLTNIVNANLKTSKSIDYSDDLPFAEMISTIPSSVKEINIILITPGGSAQQVAKFVDKLRPRFEKVTFIIPSIAMSAGTIFVMSGDDIIMNAQACIGPIDPQVPNKDGMFVPAQSILTLINEIKDRGQALINKSQNPSWTDLQILRQIDAKEIGNAISASEYSIQLVEDYLKKYKFKSWVTHKDGSSVTEKQKEEKAKKIAETLCDHGQWKTHGHGINRDAAWSQCGIKIIHPESIVGLDRAIRRLGAMLYWVFENTTILKLYISEGYCITKCEKI